MNYEKFNPHYHKPAKFTGEAYGVKTSVEHDHSDLDIDQLMDAFETIAIGLGYHKDSWKQWIMDRADEYRNEEFEFPESYTANDFKKDEEEFENLRHRYRATEEDESEFSDEDYEGQFEDWKNETPDEDEFDDYGMRIPEDRVNFEWGDEPEEDEDLFEADVWESNENLKDANERYKSEVKKMNAKQKRNK